ncbi:hypothetical protein Tco_0436569 [Tanacetum coccineum]
MKKAFLIPKIRGRGKGVKEKESILADDQAKEDNYVNKVASSFSIKKSGKTNDETVNGGSSAVDDLVVASGNANGMDEGKSATATKLGTPLMLDYYTSDMCMQSWGRSSYERAMIKLQADVELKYTIMVAMPKLVMEGFYKLLFVLSLDVAKNLKNPSQAPRGVLVGPKFAGIMEDTYENVDYDYDPYDDDMYEGQETPDNV